MMGTRRKEERQDYSAWQRTNDKGLKCATCKYEAPSTAKSLGPARSSQKAGRPDASRPSTAFTLGVQSSPSNKQTHLKSSGKSGAAGKPKENKILLMMIKSQKLALAQLEKQCEDLEEVNTGLIESIRHLDASTAAEASTLLQQYDRSGGNIASVQAWSQRQLSEARDNLQEAKEMAEKRLTELEQQLLVLNAKLEVSQAELHTLRTYKDKVYPVQVLRIAELQREARQLQEAHRDEKGDIEALADTELLKLTLMVQSRNAKILEKTAETAMCSYSSDLRLMSHHNLVLAKEVRMHKEAIKELKTDIKHLKEEQAVLLGSCMERRLQIFPEVLLQRPKCPPDMEITLDIPLEKPIPI